MAYMLLCLLVICFVSRLQAQSFTKESPYLNIRLMDLSVTEWKDSMLDKMEEVLDSELKYIDEKKGVQCKSINFEQEAGYPQRDARFLDLHIRGLCFDEKGVQHDIEKQFMTEAIIRHLDDLREVIRAPIYKIGNVQLYKRNRNKLNLIIIPISVSFVLFLLILTFFLRSFRNRQKRRHIEGEIEKRRAAGIKKVLAIPTTANTDPHASEKQRLLQLDPTVVGSASDTLGSPKEFTHEQFPSPSRNNPSGVSTDNRYNQGGAPPSLPSKDNRPPYYGHDDESSFQTQRPLRGNRERVPVPYENAPHFSPTHSQYPYQPYHPEMVPMQEHQPRVVVKSVRDDGNYPTYYHQQQEEPSTNFTPIPVQIERGSPQRGFVPPPYHSDPYYRHTNA